MAHRLTIEPQSVQETMLLHVWGMAKYSHLYPELLDDHRALEIMGKIDYDFSKVEKGFDENSGIGWLVRARNFDDAINEYIKKYPEEGNRKHQDDTIRQGARTLRRKRGCCAAPRCASDDDGYG